MKIKGAELRAFYAAWPQGSDWYHEDGALYTDEDGIICADDVVYDLDEAIGFVSWQGCDAEPTSVVVNGVSIRHVPADGLNLAAVLRAWRKDAKVLTIRVPHDKIEAVKDAVVAAGGTVL